LVDLYFVFGSLFVPLSCVFSFLIISGVPIYVWISILVVLADVSRFGLLFKGWNTPQVFLLFNLIHFSLLKKIRRVVLT